MVKPDEEEFLIDLYFKGKRQSVRELISCRIEEMNGKRAHYLLSKWSDKGWYEYGVSLDLGWLTPAGLAEAKRLWNSKDAIGDERKSNGKNLPNP